jgi:hypothetical protein
MRRALLLFACSIACACGNETSRRGEPRETSPAPTSSASPKPSSSSAEPWPKLSPLPELSNSVARQKGSDLVTATRLVVGKLVPEDPIAFVLRFEDADEKPVAKDHALGGKRLDVYELVGSIGLRVKGPAGERNLSTKSAPEKHPWGIQLWEHEGVAFAIDALGVRMGTKVWPWADPPGTTLFAAPGTYTVHLTGKLVLDGGAPMPFESAAMTVEVAAASPSRLALSAIEGKAAAAVAGKMGLPTPPPPSKLTIEDAAGNRVVRFSIHDGAGHYDLQFVEVVVAPGGEVRSMDRSKIFTCIAEGTPIETPVGPRPIESLHEGDAVWGYDLSTATRVPARVRGVVRATSDATLEIAPGLRLTARHPVFAGGTFVDAGDLATGALLLGADLRSLELTWLPVRRGPARVIDLSVSWPHTYFAGGFLVHNKAAATRAGMAAGRDDWDSIGFRPGTKLKP